KVGIKPGDIGLLDRSDEVPVELLQLGALLFVVGHGAAPLGWGKRPSVRSDDLAIAIGENPGSGSLAPLRQCNWASSQSCAPSCTITNRCESRLGVRFHRAMWVYRQQGTENRRKAALEGGRAGRCVGHSSAAGGRGCRGGGDRRHDGSLG